MKIDNPKFGNMFTEAEKRAIRKQHSIFKGGDMAKEKIKVGDNVQLNSGGPLMTVTDIQEVVQVEWVDDGGFSHAAIFPAACVRKQKDLPSKF